MNLRYRRSIFIPLVPACAAMVVSSGGCSEAALDIGTSPDGGSTSSTFAPVGSDGGAEASIGAPIAMCIATECPYPYATCSDEPGFLCGTNLRNDPANCGACGNSCEGFEAIGMSTRCIEGQCQFECITIDAVETVSPERILRNCNGMLDDGCEADVYSDPENCGACGNACKPGIACIAGRCGCPPGMTDCNGKCIDTSSDVYNCGACWNMCFDPPECGNLWEKNASAACVDGACGEVRCNENWADCNGDMSDCATSDGCETNTITNDHCGGCNIKCGPDESCRQDGFIYRCIPTCEAIGLADCGNYNCRDLRGDVDYCGSCSNKCPAPGPRQRRLCHKGTCELECTAGFADCNGDPNDGCEIDLNAHPANCGACGNRCDIAAGQPCIEGRCLMRECAPEEAR